MPSVRNTIKPSPTAEGGKIKGKIYAQKISTYKFCLIAKRIRGKNNKMHTK